MRSSLIINHDNVCGVFCNLARAYEIALLGNFKIRLIKSNNIDDNVPTNVDLELISNFFSGVEYTNDLNDLDSIILHVEINMPHINEIFSPRKSENFNDIDHRVSIGLSNQLPVFVLSESGKALLGAAYNRVKLNLNELDSIVEVSRVIARLHGSKEIKLEYLAEAIQYFSYQR